MSMATCDEQMRALEPWFYSDHHEVKYDLNSKMYRCIVY
jgi:hypothetical protein